MESVKWKKPEITIFIDLAGRDLTTGSVVPVKAEDIANSTKKYVFRFKDSDGTVNTYNEYHVTESEGQTVIVIDRLDFENSHYYITGDVLTYVEGEGYFMDTDKDLDTSNMPADAKVTGDNIRAIYNNLADEFTTASNYYVGDYCIYQGVLYQFNSDHSAGAWVAGDATQISVADELTEINEFEANTKASLADEFDATKDYAVGDYVLRSDKLYVFTSAHTAGAWDSGDVELAVLANDVTDLKSDLTNTKDILFNTLQNNNYLSLPVTGVASATAGTTVYKFLDDNSITFSADKSYLL